MDQAEFDETSGVLRGLLIRVGDRTTDDGLTLVTEFIDAGELGLALEWLADDLAEYEQPLTADERSDMLALVRQMEMGPRVGNALAGPGSLVWLTLTSAGPVDTRGMSGRGGGPRRSCDRDAT